MNRVVITGMGVISSAGVNLGDFWETLESGRVVYGEIAEYKNDNNYRIKIGSKIEGDLWQGGIPGDLIGKLGKAAGYCLSASLSALENADIEPGNLSKLRTAVVLSTTMGEIQVEEQLSIIKSRDGINKVPQAFFEQYKLENILSAMCDFYGVSGPMYMVPAACAGGNYAVGLGKSILEWGEADIVIAGGFDVFSKVAFTGFQRLLSLAPDFCKPFDRDRKGLVLGEGCGIVILEKESSAKARNVRIYCDLAGVGLTSDRHHMTAPHPEGDGAVRAMDSAINAAGITSGEICYVSAHGTGTPSNDKIEVKALETVFGSGKVPPLSSIKSMVGHPMGAAGAIELIASVLMMEKGIMVPTVNYCNPDSECDIDCVPNKPRKARLNYILSNSFGFGGQSSSLVIRKR